MVIRQNDDGKNGSFYVGEFADRQAEINYRWKEKDLIVIDHTEVNEDLGGKGVGKELVARVVELAREKNAKITVLCTFAKKVIDSSPEFSKLLSA